MSDTPPANLNKAYLDAANTIPIREPNAKHRSHFTKVAPVFRNIENFLVRKIKEYPAIVGSVFNVGSLPIANALSGCEKVFLITQNANFRDEYLSKRKWENHLGWNCYPFQTSVQSIFNNTRTRWFVEVKSEDYYIKMLNELMEPEQEKAKEEIVEISSKIRDQFKRIWSEEQIAKHIAEFPDLTEVAKYGSLFKPIWIPGSKVLIYSNGNTNSSSSALMHHKFIVFLERVEKLFKPIANPDTCWNCDSKLEDLDACFWDELSEETATSGRIVMSETQCLECGESITVHNPKYVNKFPRHNPRYQPVAVWTGSFNFTYSAANKHLENGVFIDNPEIASIYFQEWAMNFAISQKFELSKSK
ncbi:phospholipase D-like domain-containing protein [Leptolyngbya sp. FACHB-17]|uniref:phospholipase D-like domain-containing protein n=1 Tax=unclassified Leptolyngbya TaxID=2650499 RepID=UPI0016815E62|nr:phospholipase D-like domain-containing protein [Leptolyngbya sp. FACHB-17]MBD2078393.1 hypothetical protein [Leptolyngbya sp. FACHB-17]